MRSDHSFSYINLQDSMDFVEENIGNKKFIEEHKIIEVEDFITYNIGKHFEECF